MYLTGVITMLGKIAINLLKVIHTFFIIALFLLHIRGGESQVSVTRTRPSGIRSVCPNATAIFTCQVTGSSVIVWTSAEYIGQNQAAFSISSMAGTTIDVNAGIAILVQNSDGILESELRIRASVLNSSISCLPDNVNSGVTVNLTVYNSKFNQHVLIEKNSKELPHSGNFSRVATKFQIGDSREICCLESL